MRKLTTVAFCRAFDNGADWWRTIEPFCLARANGHDCYASIRGHDLVHRPDVLVFRGEFFEPDGPHSWQAFLRQCERDRVLVVLDYDDAYHAYPGYATSARKVEACRVAARYAHVVTTTTERLAEEIARFSGRHDVYVVPNAINLATWQSLSPPDPEHPVILVAGGDSHTGDWRDVPYVFSAIARQHPTVRFRVAGHDTTEIIALRDALGDRLDLRPFVRFEAYPRSFESTSIVWEPLEETIFNRGRSPIRHWEATAAGAAFIGSPLVYDQSVTDSEDGYLTDDPEYVIELCLRLLSDERERSRTVSLARQTVQGRMLTGECVDARFEIYYEEWKERHGASAIQSLRTSKKSGLAIADPPGSGHWALRDSRGASRLR